MSAPLFTGHRPLTTDHCYSGEPGRKAGIHPPESRPPRFDSQARGLPLALGRAISNPEALLGWISNVRVARTFLSEAFEPMTSKRSPSPAPRLDSLDRADYQQSRY